MDLLKNERVFDVGCIFIVFGRLLRLCVFNELGEVVIMVIEIGGIGIGFVLIFF